MRSLVYDMLYSKLAFGTTFEAYGLFGFWNRSDAGKAEFFSTYRMRFMYRLGVKKYSKYFDDKYCAYQTYKEYYRREAVKVTLPQDRDAFLDFAKKFGSFVIKPLAAFQGEGVQVLRELEHADLVTYVEGLPAGEYILEELIMQDEGMAVFHPSSVNTIRMATYFDGTNMLKLYAYLRMGMGDNFVDNVHAGGIFAAVDMETGIIITRGTRLSGETFLTHPQTGQKILGYQIPRWNELLEMMEKVVRVNPSVKLVGWDLALSQKGWCIVEGNSGPSLIDYQMCTGMGLAETINEIMRLEMKRKAVS